MKSDNVKEISIDNLERLCVFPEREKFTLIYRSAAEVHWDNESSFLYSPKPREWTYLDWYGQITSVVLDEYDCKLLITPKTTWFNIPDALKKEILNEFPPPPLVPH